MGGYFPPRELPLISDRKKRHRDFPLRVNILSKWAKEGFRPGHPPPDYPPFPLPGSFHLRLMKDRPGHADYTVHRSLQMMQVITNMRNGHRKKLRHWNQIKRSTANIYVSEFLGAFVVSRRTTPHHSGGSSHISFTHSNLRFCFRSDV